MSRAQLVSYLVTAIDRLAARRAAPADLLAWRDSNVEKFALRGAHTPGRKRREVEAVNAYQTALQRAYTEWADDLAQDVAAAEDEGDRDEIIAAALLALLLLLRKLGRDTLPDAVALGLDGTSAPATVWAKLTAAIEANDSVLADSLIPALKLKLDSILEEVSSIPYIQFDPEPIAAAVNGGLLAFLGRIGLFAGEWWGLWNFIHGTAADEKGEPITAYLDPAAHHCIECPQFHSVEGEEYSSFENYLAATGGRVPGDFQCGSNCRCWID